MTTREGALVASRYRVQALLARGGMADVYQARDERLQREVALKVFRSDEADLVRFRHETELLARLEHPNLVRILDGGEESGTPFVVLDRCPSALSEEIAVGPLAPGRVARVGRDVASALAYTHAEGVVHRDLKPSNILIGEDGRALLSDFGIARLVDGTRLTRTGFALGTAAYLAPEQAAGEEVGPPADVYALGLVLIEALTGRLAFQGTPREQLAARLVRGPRIPDSLPPPWPALLAAMTATDPADRPSAEAVREVLSGGDLEATAVMPQAHLPTATMPAAATAPLRTMPVAAHGWRARVPAVLLVALLAGVAMAWAVSGGDGGALDPPPTTTTKPTTTATAPAAAVQPPPGSDRRGPSCEALEEQKRAIEADKRSVEKQHRDDKEARKQLKEALEEQKRAIDEQKKQAGC